MGFARGVGGRFCCDSLGVEIGGDWQRFDLRIEGALAFFNAGEALACAVCGSCQRLRAGFGGGSGCGERFEFGFGLGAGCDRGGFGSLRGL